MNLLKRLREHKEIKNINTNDRVREESLEDIGEDDDQQNNYEDNGVEVDDLSDHIIGESSDNVI